MIRDLFFGNCEHEYIKKTVRHITEHRCDKCSKVLLNKDEGDFCVERNTEYLRNAQNEDINDPLLA